MRFEITRTSDWKNEFRPVEGAEKSVNQKGRTRWTIDIASLEALIRLCEAEELILGCKVDGSPYLEVYDDYRE